MPPRWRPARQLLMDILEFFGLEIIPEEVVDVPENVRFATRTYPNPFNPVTKIEYTVPRAGELTLKIFNVRGELVRTLIDGLVEQQRAHHVGRHQRRRLVGFVGGLLQRGALRRRDQRPEDDPGEVISAGSCHRTEEGAAPTGAAPHFTIVRANIFVRWATPPGPSMAPAMPPLS